MQIKKIEDLTDTQLETVVASLKGADVHPRTLLKINSLAYKSREEIFVELLRQNKISVDDVLPKDFEFELGADDVEFIKKLGQGYTAKDFNVRFNALSAYLTFILSRSNTLQNSDKMRGNKGVIAIAAAIKNNLVKLEDIQPLSGDLDKSTLPRKKFTKTGDLNRFAVEGSTKVAVGVGTRFTKRDFSIVDAILEGSTRASETADAASLKDGSGVLSAQTVRLRTSSMYSAAGVRTFPALIVYLKKHGLLNNTIPMPESVHAVHLNDRLINMVRMVAEGKTNKRMSELLHLNAADIKRDLDNVKELWKLNNDSQVVYWSMEKGYFSAADIELDPANTQNLSSQHSVVADDGKRYRAYERDALYTLATNEGDGMDEYRYAKHDQLLTLPRYDKDSDKVYLKQYINGISKKMGVTGRLDILRYAVNNKIIDPATAARDVVGDVNSVSVDDWLNLKKIWDIGAIAADDNSVAASLTRASRAWNTTRIKALMYAKQTGLLD